MPKQFGSQGNSVTGRPTGHLWMPAFAAAHSSFDSGAEWFIALGGVPAA